MRRTFRVRSVVRQLVPLIVTCVVTMAIMFAVVEPDAHLAVWLTGGVLLGSVLVAAWLLTRTRLDIGPEGVTYHAIGYRIVADWDQVAGYGRRVQGASEIESLILRGPGLEMSGWMGAAYRLLPAASLVALLGGRAPQPTDTARFDSVIPVGMFDTDWRSGEIGALVRQYAPTAFDTPMP